MRTVLVALVLAVPAILVLPGVLASNCAGTGTGLVPLPDLGPASWNGQQGGLYPGGVNVRPLPHTLLGLVLAGQVAPRALDGTPDPNGKVVFLSIGMSNTRNEFSQFVLESNADPLRHPRVQAVNGAIGGQTAAAISNPSAPYWAQVDLLLAAAGASPKQVQAVWLKEADAGPSGDPIAHVDRFEGEMLRIFDILEQRFPNNHLIYMSSRIYAGYASTGLNPEPYAYAYGFGVKDLVARQLAGEMPLLAPGQAFPANAWLSWGPYLWADGLTPRGGDGLTWLCSDFASDGTHPNVAGSQKVSRQLLDFVHTDPTAQTWYMRAGSVLPVGLSG